MYWKKIGGDVKEVPNEIKVVLFDFAVQHGPSKGIKFLQNVIGTTEDGILGETDRAALKKTIRII